MPFEAHKKPNETIHRSDVLLHRPAVRSSRTVTRGVSISSLGGLGSAAISCGVRIWPSAWLSILLTTCSASPYRRLLTK